MADAVANAKSIHVLEVAALARSHAGKPTEAIARLEVLIDTFGPTPERLDYLGGKYKGLIGVATTSDEKLRYQRSIQCYTPGDRPRPRLRTTAPPICLPSIASATETETRSVSRPYCKTRLPLASEQKGTARPTNGFALRCSQPSSTPEMQIGRKSCLTRLPAKVSRWKIDLLDYLDASIERIKDSHLRLRLCAVIRQFRSVLPPTAS